MQPASTSHLLSETMTPREIGAYMAELRQQFNLTPQEVSERLHIRTRYISAIEESKFELMPGKVYARGYIHTYAEFLGLDGEQAVRLCFAGDGTVTAPTPTLVSVARPLPGHSMKQRNWRGYGVMGVIVIAVALLVSQLTGHSDSSPSEEAIVAPVPEDILQSVRNLVMPTPGNFECLTRDSALGCFYADSAIADLTRLENDNQMRFVGDIDLSSMALPMAIEDEDAQAETPVETGGETAPLDEEVPPTGTSDE